MIFTLLRPNRIAALRFMAPAEKGALGRLVFAGLLAVAVTAVVYYATYRALVFFSGVEVIGRLLTARLLEFTFLGVMSFVFLSAFVTVLGTFYLAEDLLLVRAAPLSEPAFFTARWLQSAVLAGWMVLGIGAPVLAAYGAALGGGLLYALVCVLAYLPLVLLPTAVGVTVMTGLVCVFPARRVRDLFVVLGVVGIALMALLLRIAQPERLMRPEVFGSVTNYVAAFQAPQSAWLPSTWSAAAVRAAQEGRFDALSLALAWTAVWAAASLAYLVHRRWYRLAYSRAQEGGPGNFSTGGVFERFFDRLQAPLAPEVRAFARKDTRLFLRDPGQWSQLLILLTLIVAYVYNFAVFPGTDVKLAGLRLNLVLGVLNVILAGFVISALVARFAFPAVSVEGRAFWLVRTAPVSPRRFLRTKFVIALTPMLALSVLLAGLTAYWLKLPAPLVAVTVVHIALTTAVMTALGLGLGAIYPRFRFENPAQVPMSFGGIVFMLLATVYNLVGGFATAWLAAPLAFPHVTRGSGIMLISLVVWLTFHLLHAIIPLRLAGRALAAKEYS